MAYSDDLIEQARHLVEMDRTGRPRQANIRRAVSAAYYAVFHETVDKAAKSILSVANADGPIGARVRRLISHANLLKASKWFALGGIPQTISEMRGDTSGKKSLPPALQQLCLVIVDLQPSRHGADYDFHEDWYRPEAQRLISSAESALLALRSLPSNDVDTTVFFLSVLFGDNLSRNS